MMFQKSTWQNHTDGNPEDGLVIKKILHCQHQMERNNIGLYIFMTT